MLGGAYGRIVDVIAGPGNNGADGRVAAERLRERGASPCACTTRASVPAALPDVRSRDRRRLRHRFHGAWTAPDVGARPVLAVDIPTGLDADTGAPPAGVLRADRTVTFAAAKPGHLLGDGPDVVGDLVVVDIGLDVG